MQEVFQKAIFVADFEVLGDPPLVVVEDAIELGHVGVAVFAKPIYNV